jgi:molybdopterin molybdotransferase
MSNSETFSFNILDNIEINPANQETISIENGYERVLACDIDSPQDIPQFNHSLMDGFAVFADNIKSKQVSIVGEVFIGIEPDFIVKSNETAKIPTGGMLPNGTDSVIPIEDVSIINDNTIEIKKTINKGQFVRHIGQDIRKGEIVFHKGQRLSPYDIGRLAGLGITEIQVKERPIVSIISTGNELVSPESIIQIGQVRDVNSYTLYGLISKAGGVPIKKGIFKDDYNIIREIIKTSAETSHMVIITGGSGAGTLDHTVRIIKELGIFVEGVKRKGGKPLIVGTINKTPIFGLPGNPLSISGIFETYVLRILNSILCYNK